MIRIFFEICNKISLFLKVWVISKILDFVTFDSIFAEVKSVHQDNETCNQYENFV